MGVLDLERDYEYFKGIWEYREPNRIKHTKDAWDGRAEDWGKELEKSCSFCKSVDDRVEKAAAFLRAHGLLGEGSEVADIGCGPGRFVAEFAKTAGHVTGVDLSPKMLELGESYAKTLGCENVTFRQADLNTFSVEDAGWEGKFDLVFTSITPAIGTMDNLEKIMKISRGYCFNSCFVRWNDELELLVGRDVFGIKDVTPRNNHAHWFYSLFNLLWLKGYFPETAYHRQNQEEYVEADEDLARYYAKCFAGMNPDEDSISRVHRYLKDHALPDGTIMRKYERWYGWILWDVRERDERLHKTEER